MAIIDREKRQKEVLTPGHVKGGIVKAHLQWIRDHHGEAAIQQVVSSLPPAAADEVNAALASAWCNFSSLVELDRAIEAKFGAGNAAFLRELGRYSAHLNLSGTYKAFRRDDLHEFFRKSTLLHRQFQDFGEAKYTQQSDSSCTIEHSRFPCFSPTYCESALGYFEQVVTEHGAKPKSVAETSCQCAGDASCVYEVSW